MACVQPEYSFGIAQDPNARKAIPMASPLQLIYQNARTKVNAGQLYRNGAMVVV
jgi:hypothetical protein